MFQAIKHFFKFLYISSIIIIHRNNIAIALEKLGPSFIKLGQFLSTRPDLVGQNIAQQLSYLRDKLPSFPYSKVKEIFHKEFNAYPEDLFKEFYEIPVAAASIAQVHKAITKEGEEVAVKVRRPDIEKILKKDVQLFYFIANLIEKLVPKYKRLKLKEVVKTIETSFRFETDLSFEAAAASELIENNKLDFVKIPDIYWSLTSTQIFTMEWVDATPIHNQEQLALLNIDLKILATNLAVMFLSQAFIDGFFHADLHQGNIMVNKDGKIILLDFGIMGRLKYKDRTYIAQILHGFLKRDYSLIAKLHKKVGYIDKSCDVDLFAQSCRAIGEPIMSLPPDKISIAKLLGQLFKITEDFQMETQPQLLLMQKTMIMVEGIGKILCKDKNLWVLSEPWIKKWAEENISPEVKAAKIIKKLVHNIINKIVEEI